MLNEISGAGKLPPQAREIEEQILGSMLQFRESQLLGVSQLSIDHFYVPAHQKIFEAMLLLDKKSRSIDIVTVSEELRNEGTLQLSGGPGYVAKLTVGVSARHAFDTHVLILSEKKIKRKQIELAGELMKMAYNETIDALETNDFLNDSAYEISKISSFRKEISNAETIEEIKKQVEKAAEMKGLTGVNSGFNELNSVFGGFQPSELYVLGGRPGMGKTALSLSLSLNASELGNNGLFFSLEMGRAQLFKRLLSMQSGLTGDDLKHGSLSTDQWQQFHNASGELEKLPFKVVDDVYSLNGIIAVAKMERLKGKIDYIIIDYLQLIENNIKGGSREQEISQASRKLKLLSKDFNIPVIALCQLSRAVEARGGDKRPMLSDLRESGAIEQDADVVMFVYRAEYYGFTENSNGEDTKGIAEVLIAKNRNGSLGNYELKFEHATTNFRDKDSFYSPNMGIEANKEF